MQLVVPIRAVSRALLERLDIFDTDQSGPNPAVDPATNWIELVAVGLQGCQGNLQAIAKELSIPRSLEPRVPGLEYG